jgi:glutamate racemase
MAPSQNNPIGVIDSGVGGISVLKCIRARLPHENLIYVADSKFAPYGEKSNEEITHRVLTVFNFLNKQEVKSVVVACNTATASSIQVVRDKFYYPIIGMEPAVKPASLMSKNKVVGILATSGTLLSAKFSALLEHHANDIHFITQPCFGLVELVEQGDLESSILTTLLKKYIDPLLKENIDTLVLGCTHYSFIKPAIQKLMPEHIKIVETGEAVANYLKHVLEEKHLLNQNNVLGTTDFWTNSLDQNAENVIAKLWGGTPENFNYKGIWV